MPQVGLQVIDDDSRPGGGYARLIFEGQADQAGQSVTVTLRRGGDSDPWLGPRGWQPGEHAFKPAAVEAEGGDLVVVVGPEVVAHIETFTTVQATLPELQLSGVASWEATPSYVPEARAAEAPAVTPATPPPPSAPPQRLRVPFSLRADGLVELQLPEGDLGGVELPREVKEGDAVLGVEYASLRKVFHGELDIDPAAAAARVLPGAGGPPREINFTVDPSGAVALQGEPGYSETLTAGQPAFGVDAAALAAAQSGVITLDPETVTGQIVAPKEDEKVDETEPLPPPEKKSWLPWALIAVALLIAAGAGYWYVSQEETPVVENGEDDQQQDGEQQAEEDQPADEGQQEESGEAEQDAEEETAEPTPDELYELGVAAHEAGRNDEARTLLRQAERAGHGPAALYMAQQIDSLDFTPGLFTDFDDIEALRLYGVACRQGAAGAAEGVAQLKAELEARSGQGDIIAGEIVRGPLTQAMEACP